MLLVGCEKTICNESTPTPKTVSISVLLAQSNPIPFSIKYLRRFGSLQHLIPSRI
jgi:hypothetical protein